jgi:Zn-dependent protease with chaperone function
MSLPYFLRLLCICFSALFLVHAAAAAGVTIAAPGAIRLARGMRARLASRFLFGLRMLPLGLAGFVVLGLCVPSFLWLEPQGGGEQVGWPCLAMALLGAAMSLGSAARVAGASLRSLQFRRAWGNTRGDIWIDGELVSMTIVPQQAPLLAVAGIIRHKLVVSSSVLQALSPDELCAALRHERAHRVWRDNFKRLVFLAAPRGFVFSRKLGAIEHQWSRLAEWAADDHAAGGDSQRALSLATALVQVARLGSAAPQPAILSPFLDSQNLSERVDRLLHVVQSNKKCSRKTPAMIGCAVLLVTCFLSAAMLWPASLSIVHFLLERLID